MSFHDHLSILIADDCAIAMKHTFPVMPWIVIMEDILHMRLHQGLIAPVHINRSLSLVQLHLFPSLNKHQLSAGEENTDNPTCHRTFLATRKSLTYPHTCVQSQLRLTQRFGIPATLDLLHRPHHAPCLPRRHQSRAREMCSIPVAILQHHHVHQPHAAHCTLVLGLEMPISMRERA